MVVADRPDEAVAGARLALFDRDEFSEDDWLGSEVTDESGQAQFLFHTDQFRDTEDPGSYSLAGLPDLYVVVYDRGGNSIFTSRQEFRRNAIPREFIVTVPRALLEEHGFFSDE